MIKWTESEKMVLHWLKGIALIVLGIVLMVLGHAVFACLLALALFVVTWIAWYLITTYLASTVSTRDLSDARMRALRMGLPEPTEEEANRLTNEVMTGASWMGGYRNQALYGYFHDDHDADEMERLMHERVFPKGWERGELIRRMESYAGHPDRAVWDEWVTNLKVKP
jgi:hypothetical protein